MYGDRVCGALKGALVRRGHPQGVRVYSDCGSQYCSNNYRFSVEKYHLIDSMSAKGVCYDN